MREVAGLIAEPVDTHQQFEFTQCLFEAVAGIRNRQQGVRRLDKKPLDFTAEDIVGQHGRWLLAGHAGQVVAAMEAQF